MAPKELWVSMEFVSQFVTFKVKKLTLAKDAMKRASAIGTFVDDQIKQEEEATKFLREVPMEISCPMFGIGGWFRATTKECIILLQIGTLVDLVFCKENIWTMSFKN